MERRDRKFALIVLALLLGVPAGVSAAHIALHQQTLTFEGCSWVVLTTDQSRVSVRNPNGGQEYNLFLEEGVLHRDRQPFYWGRQGLPPRVEEPVTDEDRRLYTFYRQQPQN
jgi:hypothetical protein